MTENDALTMLSHNGNLVKRPFAISNAVHLLGFDEEAWEKSLH